MPRLMLALVPYGRYFFGYLSQKILFGKIKNTLVSCRTEFDKNKVKGRRAN